MKKVLFMVIISFCASFAQHRVLVTPNNEVISLNKGISAIEMIPQPITFTSTNNIKSGYPPDIFPSEGEVRGNHKDVLGTWLIVPHTGIIDTLFILTGLHNTPYESTIVVRVHRSHIYPGSGPGENSYPSPCTSWGYWQNENDHDQGIAAFRDDATDTTWHSTLGISPPSFPPVGEELWAQNGLNYTVGVNKILAVPMNDWPVPLNVTVGDPIFISEKINTYQWVHDFIDFPGAISVNASQAPTPSRAWKFFEHPNDQTSLGCTDASPSLPMGWWAIGGQTGYNDAYLPNIWFSMTTLDNTAPIITPEILGHTLETGPRTVTAEIEDSNPASSENADVSQVTLTYIIEKIGGDSNTIPMNFVGGNTWSAVIPTTPLNGTVHYSIKASDNLGLSTQTPFYQYKVLRLENAFYSLDTSIEYQWVDIETTGTRINQWFPKSSNPWFDTKPDNRTAGPFDLGGEFKYFDSYFRYAWVGVDGGITLTDDPLDTILINRCDNRFPFIPPSTSIARNFIAPLFNDFVLEYDTTDRSKNSIYYKSDSNKFIVEWKNIERLNYPTDTSITFELILDRDDHSITFQYNDVGNSGIATSSFIGLQQDTLEHWLFISGNGNPEVLRPRNERSFRLFPNIYVAPVEHWNLLSLPVAVSNKHRTSVFPEASSVYGYNNGYVRVDTIENGHGYWVRFDDYSKQPFRGTKLFSDIFSLKQGWNIIGSISEPVPVSSLLINPDTAITTFFYGFTNGYHIADTIYPGAGYWVKAKTPANIELHASTFLSKHATLLLSSFNTITIEDGRGRKQNLYCTTHNDRLSSQQLEMPPFPPKGAFDARFTSNRIIEVLDEESDNEIPIQLTSEAYPLVVTWQLQPDFGAIYLLIDDREINLRQKHNVKIQTQPSYVALKLQRESVEPLTFGLEQNYPNPFNPTTNIRFRIEKSRHGGQVGLVTLKVFDVLGREATTLVNKEMDPGSYTVQWDANGLPSGVYIYRLQAGSFSDMKKMLLIR